MLWYTIACYILYYTGGETADHGARHGPGGREHHHLQDEGRHGDEQQQTNKQSISQSIIKQTNKQASKQTSNTSNTNKTSNTNNTNNTN